MLISAEFNVVVALLIAFFKASLVAWIFMGVRYSTTLTRLFVVAGLVWLSIMILITFERLHQPQLDLPGPTVVPR